MKLIAHACGPTIYPSNTIFSAREALKNGADMVELDLQYTSDKKIAVLHDKTLLKQYGLDKRCRETTSQEFLSLRRIKYIPSYYCKTRVNSKNSHMSILSEK